MIEEAKETKLKKKTKKTKAWQKWTAVAACAVLVFGMGMLFIKDGIGTTSNIKPILDVIYPKAYAFDDNNAAREVREQNPVDDSFITALNDFSYKTGTLILKESGENINYSPLSLYYALSIAASGARNETADEILALLGMADTQVLSEQCGNLYRALYFYNEIGKLKIANSLWIDDDMNGIPIVFKDDFVEQTAENFYASSYSVDFAKEETGKSMAEWVANNTNGTLSPSFEVNPYQILSIVNTVYFYDQWSDRFDKDKTAEDVFYLSDGSELKCDFMNQSFGSAGFAKGGGFTRADLGLKNAGRMVFILPDEGISPYELLSSPEQMQELFEGGENSYGEVTWKIPKFSFSSKLPLKKVLISLGINSAFNIDADFSGITDTPAYITDVRQETHIAIDEKGVEASAFTEIQFAGAGLPEDRAEMILDRPFIYGITAQNGSLLFVGVCENPVTK
jgi:serpin B